MKTLKLAVLPVALFATSAFADEVIVDQQVVAEPVAVSTTTYNPNNGIIKNTTTQLVEGTKTFFNKATHPAAISAEIGTLGYGGNIAWGVNDKTELVAGWNGGSFDDTINLDANDSYLNYKKILGDGYEDFKGDFKYDLDMNNPYLGVNLRPWGNGFTVGTGVIYNDNTLKATLTPRAGETATVKAKDGDKAIVASGSSVSVEAESRNDLAPYLTIGYRPNISERWGVFGELGAAYVGDVKTTVTGTAGTERAQEIVKERLDDKNLKWLPIAKVGATVRF
ncbi:hypothetical protein [Faucicola boevrei]|uniref:hypothetical protein n=1 Tax=Faucicola boevrei TaxID=346665 RepID=UPI000363B825|nr:hypothetical protein [Moraxella boevrei]